MIIRNVLLKGNIMKKTKAISMLILTLLSGMAVFFISACDGASTGGVRYTVKGDHAVVSGCSKAIAQVTIQPEYEGVPVTEIDDMAFRECSVKKVVIPENVTVIGQAAFAECTDLSEVTLPKSLEKIGEKAFRKCTSLKEIIIPEGVTYIDREAFRDCFSLNNAVLPESLKRLETYAFQHCTKLEEIHIPGSVEKFGEAVFQECHALKRIYLGEGITECELGMKSLSDSLEEVYYPASYTGRTFYGKTAYLSNIDCVRYAEESVVNYQFGEGYSPVVCSLGDALSAGLAEWNCNVHTFGAVDGNVDIINKSGKDLIIELADGDVIPTGDLQEGFTVQQAAKIFLSGKGGNYETLGVEFLKPYYFESGYSAEESYLSLNGEDTYYRLIRTDGKVEFAIRLTGGETQKMSFPAGQYELKIASGDNWLGEEKMYGENGDYTTTGLFTFQPGNVYMITASQFGNISKDYAPWIN